MGVFSIHERHGSRTSEGEVNRNMEDEGTSSRLLQQQRASVGTNLPWHVDKTLVSEVKKEVLSGQASVPKKVSLLRRRREEASSHLLLVIARAAVTGSPGASSAAAGCSALGFCGTEPVPMT